MKKEGIQTPRILIATGLYAPEMGGPATYTAFLEKHLPEAGVEYRVVPFSDVRRLPRLVRHIAYLFRVVRLGMRTDIIYALDTVSVGLPAALASMLLRKRFFLRVPGDYAWEQGQQRFGIKENLDKYLASSRRPWGVKLLDAIQKYVAQRAERIIVPSDYMKTVVAKWGIDVSKVTRIYSALKVIDVPEEKEQLRAQLGYQGFVVVTAARLVPWKGVRALIDAVTSLYGAGIQVSLKIIGDGTERESLKRHAQETGHEEVVSFLGVLPRAELGRYLKAADAFVLNTAYEGLSHQLIEVMSLGTPIITTPAGGNSELIEDGKTGLLVTYDDIEGIKKALTHIKSDPAFSASLTERAREKVALFHEDIVIKEFLELIE